MPAPGAVAATVAVKTTSSPTADGSAVDAISVVVAERLTRCVSVAVLADTSASPL
jgi:hypothetical protein